MGSRIGSIAIFIFIIVIVAAVAVVIDRIAIDTGEPDAARMVVSLVEDDLLLRDEPQPIIVTITSGSPIATLELLVDDVRVAETIPPFSNDRGAWIGSFVWTPQQLGFANVRIIALNANGVESVRQVRVEVTDDEARVAAALRVTVLGITPLQQFQAGSVILLSMSATGSQPVERFEMLVDGEFITAVTPRFDESTNAYVANVRWTPSETDEVEVTIIAVDTTGRMEERIIPIVLVTQGGSDAPQQDSAAENPDDPENEGVARITAPVDTQRFQLDDDFSLDVALSATDVGTVNIVLLYLTPVLSDNSLGSSRLIHSSGPHPPGDYEETVPDVHELIDGSGSYQLELVIFTPDEVRYDNTISIHVIEAVEEDPEPEQPAAAELPLSDEVDLAIVGARQPAGDPARLNVSITNASTVDVERTEVLLTVVDSDSGAELASTTVTFAIASDELNTVPLDLDLPPGPNIEVLVLLEADIDTNSANNTYEITLVTTSDAAAGDADDESASQPAGPAPDLSFLDAQTTSDGYVLLTVVNNGDAPADSFEVVVTDADGEQLELISRRAGASPLAAGANEVLSSLEPHAGAITVTVTALGDAAERNLANNAHSLEVGN